MNPYITKYELTYDETLMMTIVNTRNHSASGLGMQSCDPKYTFIGVFNNSGRFRTQQPTVYSTHIIHLLFTHQRAYLLSSHSLSFCSGVESGITHRAINVSFLPFSFIYRIHWNMHDDGSLYLLFTHYRPCHWSSLVLPSFSIHPPALITYMCAAVQGGLSVHSKFRAAYTYLRSFQVQDGLHVSPFIPSSGRPTRISVHPKFRTAYTYLRSSQVQSGLHVSPFIPSSGRPTRISVHPKFRAAYTYLRSFQVQDGLHLSPFIPSSGRPTRISVHSKFRTAYTYLRSSQVQGSLHVSLSLCSVQIMNTLSPIPQFRHVQNNHIHISCQSPEDTRPNV